MNCGKTYEDDSDELIEGCECGSSLFIFEKEPGEEFSEEERTEVRSDIEQMMEEGIEERENIKFRFDLDSIVVEEEGVYTINVSKLLEEVPLVIRKQEGMYHIHLPSAFEPGKTDITEEELDLND
ncbi:MAG: Zn-ribbon containing protein [Candidatus Nanohaloarchaea archaeon]